jgi:hypothetical protein
LSSQGRRRGAQEMALPRLAAALEINFPGRRLCKAKISDKEEQGEFFNSKRKRTHHHSHRVAPATNDARSATAVSSGSKAG